MDSSGLTGIGGGQQSGYTYVGNVPHAGVWSGTAASWVDLHPAGATGSYAAAVHGGRQVGQATVGGVLHASLWSGTAASRVDLHAFLSANYTSSSATGIWSDSGSLYVAGVATNSTTSNTEAMLWVYVEPVCAEWTQVTPSAAPPVRHRAVAAFDPIRGETVLYGGETAGGARLADTWTWNGSAWTQKSGPAPSPRMQHAMAFDAARGNIVVYGGRNVNSNADTWIWSGTAWSQLPVSNPGPRFGHAMAYDADHQYVLFFGGNQNGSYPNQTWSWNGTAWSQRCNCGPGGRAQFAMAFDPVHHTVVVHGGANASGVLADTWTWDGTSWTQAATTGPSARQFHQMVFDQVLGKIVLFGGVDNASIALNDTWAWDGAAWASIDRPGPMPPVRNGHAMAYDETRREAVVFGGQGSSGMLDDTWLLRAQVSPRVASQPGNVRACRGATVQFTAAGISSGSAGYTFAWRKGGVGLSLPAPRYSMTISPDGRASTLTITGVDSVDAGSGSGGYDCVVTNACGSVTSSAAALSVCASDFDCNGSLAVADIFAFLNAWFAGHPSADFDGINGLQVADIFAFLNSWFAGC